MKNEWGFLCIHGTFFLYVFFFCEQILNSIHHIFFLSDIQIIFSSTIGWYCKGLNSNFIVPWGNVQNSLLRCTILYLDSIICEIINISYPPSLNAQKEKKLFNILMIDMIFHQSLLRTQTFSCSTHLFTTSCKGINPAILITTIFGMKQISHFQNPQINTISRMILLFSTISFSFSFNRKTSLPSDPVKYFHSHSHSTENESNKIFSTRLLSAFLIVTPMWRSLKAISNDFSFEGCHPLSTYLSKAD